MAIIQPEGSLTNRKITRSSVGRPLMKNCGFFSRMTYSPAFISTNRNGPEPTGALLAGWVRTSCPSP